MSFLPGYTKRKKITIDHTKVDATTDIKVRVALTSGNFTWADTTDTGFDIQFTSSDGTTLLNFDRDYHDKPNSVAEYHVSVPSASSTVDTDFYMYFKSKVAVSAMRSVHISSDITNKKLALCRINVRGSSHWICV